MKPRLWFNHAGSLFSVGAYQLSDQSRSTGHVKNLDFLRTPREVLHQEVYCLVWCPVVQDAVVLFKNMWRSHEVFQVHHSGSLSTTACEWTRRTTKCSSTQMICLYTSAGEELLSPVRRSLPSRRRTLSFPVIRLLGRSEGSLSHRSQFCRRRT